MSREDNVEIFEDTVKLYAKDSLLKEAIVKANQNTQIIPECKDISIDALPKGNKTVIIEQSKSFDAARKRVSSGHTAVLNFASAVNPGGGVVKGSSAQEECLCRCSTLYATLSNKKCWTEFYKPHRETLGPLHNDDIIWTPNVIIFKTDDYELIPKSEWAEVSVISCAAPNLRESNPSFNVDKPLNRPITNDELFDIHYKRAIRIFNVAARKGVKNLIVGAFGCGAFKNDPVVVARAWKKAVQDYNGPELNFIFSIYDGIYSNNFEVFDKIFKL